MTWVYLNEAIQWGWLLLLTWSAFHILEAVSQLQKCKLDDLEKELGDALDRAEEL